MAGGDYKDVRTKIYRADGSISDVSLSLALMRDSAGRPMGTVGVSNAISEQVKAEEELRKAHEDLKTAYEELAKLDKMKDEFLTNISHELRTPLTSVIAALDIMVGQELSEEQEELVTVANRNADRLNALVGDILYYAKLEYLGNDLAFTQVHMGRLIRESVKSMAPIAKANKVAIKTDVGHGLVVVADKRALAKALSNLLSNAIKFNREGGKVTVKAGESDYGVRVVVSDTGIGIPREHLRKIFTRFYQVDGSIKRKYQGTGLGLAIVKSIIEKHGGEVWVDSEVGKGSEFTFEIPRVKITSIPKNY